MANASEEPRAPKPEAADIYGWKWFIVYGLAYFLLAAMTGTHILVSEMISTFIIGAVMLLGAGIGLAHARRVRDPETHNCWALSAALYLMGGVAVLLEPFIGGRLLLLALAGGLIISGLSRIVAGAQLRCMPIALSGTATVIVALVIGMDWQQGHLWVMAYAIAADLAVQGITLFIAGEELHLRRAQTA